MSDYRELQTKAISLLRDACTSYGILASPDEQDNYRRLWARDSMIAGIAGMLAEDDTIMKGWKHSLLTLAEHQHPWGMIPSNVLTRQNKEADLSYGGLAGRVDATGWFVVGACLYMINHPDKELENDLRPGLRKALDLLDRWEFNGNGLLYTPLSGNWADEYPISGHTLYDNLLRLWGLRLFEQLYGDNKRSRQADHIEERVRINFWPQLSDSDHPDVYHPRCFLEAAEKGADHYACALDPTGYNTHFDTAGHALALLLRLGTEEQLNSIFHHVDKVFAEVGSDLLPAFWPVITPDDPQWQALENNYSYNFKNQPHRFHNGGIWPVWMGWFGLGAHRSGRPELSRRMLEAWEEAGGSEITFHEYIASDTLVGGGKKRLSFSAAGLIFLVSSIRSNFAQKLRFSQSGPGS